MSLFDFELREVPWGTLGAYLRCPFEYHSRMLANDASVAPAGPEVEEGRVLHQLMHDFLALPTQERSLSYVRTRIADWASTHSGSYWNEVTRNLERVLPAFSHPLLSDLTDIEVERSCKRVYGQFLFTGRVDCVGRFRDKLIVIDFKHNEGELSHFHNALARYLQLAFYAYCLHLEPVAEDGLLELVYFFFLGGRDERSTASVEFLASAMQLVEQTVRALDADTQWQPQRNSLCSTCGVRQNNLCPLWERGV